MSDQAYQQFTQRIGIGEAEKRIEGKLQDIKTNQNKEELDKTKTLINEKIKSINDNLNNELDELKEGYKLGVQDVYHLGHDINQLKGLVKAYHKLIPMIERSTNYMNQSCRINTYMNHQKNMNDLYQENELHHNRLTRINYHMNHQHGDHHPSASLLNQKFHHYHHHHHLSVIIIIIIIRITITKPSSSSKNKIIITTTITLFHHI